MERKLRQNLATHTFDIVHFDTIGLAQYRKWVGRSACVLNHHDIESVRMMRRSETEANPLFRAYWRSQSRKLLSYEKKVCGQFDVNLAVSEEEQQALIDIVPGVRTAVVPNGVDTSYFAVRPDPRGKTLLFCGAMDLFPNRDAMVYFFSKIWPRLVVRIPDVEIFVVGRNPPKWLLKLARRDGRVYVKGFVDDVREYFQRATVFVCPVRTGGGTRIKILDSMAMGVPVVATSFAAGGLEIEHNRNVLLADTAEEFVIAVVRIVSDTRQRQSIADVAVESAKALYSWDIVGKSLLDVYDSVSANNKCASSVDVKLLAYAYPLPGRC
jgi:glycosyltransferase involved in cell wall biosynthesis